MADTRDFLLDKRTVERNIRKGLISRDDYNEHLSGLKDVEDNAEVIDFAPPEEEEGAEGEGEGEGGEAAPAAEAEPAAGEA